MPDLYIWPLMGYVKFYVIKSFQGLSLPLKDTDIRVAGYVSKVLKSYQHD